MRWHRQAAKLAVIVAAVTLLLGMTGIVPAIARPRSFFISPTRGRLSSPLGWRLDPFRQTVWRHHWGIDIAAPTGTPVLASATGTVHYAGIYAGYGGLVYLEHAGGWITLYAHLSHIAVGPGQKVAQGMVIGAVGNNGRSTGPHLHFEVRYRGMPVDPLRYLGR